MFPNEPMVDGDHITDKARHRENISKSWWNKPENERREICERLSEAHRGVYPNEETRKKLSETSLRTQNDPEFKARHSKRMSEIMTQVWKRPEYRALKSRQASEKSTKAWKDPNYRKRVFQGHRTGPSQDEEHLTFFLNKNFTDQWIYTGTTPFIGGGKRKPDWTHTSKKKVILYDTLFWHYTYFQDKEMWKERLKYYNDLGYQALILTEDDLWANRNTLKDKIEEFSNS